jgi:hypothetical protein
MENYKYAPQESSRDVRMSAAAELHLVRQGAVDAAAH